MIQLFLPPSASAPANLRTVVTACVNLRIKVPVTDPRLSVKSPMKVVELAVIPPSVSFVDVPKNVASPEIFMFM